MTEHDHPTVKKSNWRGVTLQLFLITIMPLTVLLLVVAFGSQTLHHKAMRSLVGDRDLRTVRAASSSIERELIHLTGTFQLIAREMGDQTDFSSIRFTADEIASTFEGGMAIYTQDGRIIRSITTEFDWQTIPPLTSDLFKASALKDSMPVLSDLITPPGTTQSYIFLATQTESGNVLLGAFSPKKMIDNTVGDLVNNSQGLSKK
uniref:Cache domain-containing protein n=1 Tax=Anaerolinea thermolimosa TaxID=229919 RepID=A0A7C4PNV0_9CHLR